MVSGTNLMTGRIQTMPQKLFTGKIFYFPPVSSADLLMRRIQKDKFPAKSPLFSGSDLLAGFVQTTIKIFPALTSLLSARFRCRFANAQDTKRIKKTSPARSSLFSGSGSPTGHIHTAPKTKLFQLEIHSISAGFRCTFANAQDTKTHQKNISSQICLIFWFNPDGWPRTSRNQTNVSNLNFFIFRRLPVYIC